MRRDIFVSVLLLSLVATAYAQVGGIDDAIVGSGLMNQTNGSNISDVGNATNATDISGNVTVTTVTDNESAMNTTVNITNGTMNVTENDTANETVNVTPVGVVVTSNGTQETNGSADDGMITVKIMKHLCPVDIQTEQALDGYGSIARKAALCPALRLPDDEPSSGSVAGEEGIFQIISQGPDGERKGLNEATYVRSRICEETAGEDLDGDGETSPITCYDTSYYQMRMERGNITIIEAAPYVNTRLGAYDVHYERNGSQSPDESADSVIVHLFNFRKPAGASTARNITTNVNVITIDEGDVEAQSNVSTDVTVVESEQVAVVEEDTQDVSPLVDLYVKQWYPKGPDYVFVCDPEGFTPTSYSWYYGDGKKLVNITNGDTYHVYEELGTYEVQCVATDGITTASDNLTIEVTSLDRPVWQRMRNNMASLLVKDWYPKGADYVFVCDVTGFDPTRFTWFYGDGEKLVNITNSDTYHVFQARGGFEVQCIAQDEAGNTANASTRVNVTTTERPGVQVPAQDGTGAEDANPNATGNMTGEDDVLEDSTGIENNSTAGGISDAIQNTTVNSSINTTVNMSVNASINTTQNMTG